MLIFKSSCHKHLTSATSEPKPFWSAGQVWVSGHKGPRCWRGYVFLWLGFSIPLTKDVPQKVWFLHYHMETNKDLPQFSWGIWLRGKARTHTHTHTQKKTYWLHRVMTKDTDTQTYSCLYIEQTIDTHFCWNCNSKWYTAKCVKSQKCRCSRITHTSPLHLNNRALMMLHLVGYVYAKWPCPFSYAAGKKSENHTVSLDYVAIYMRVSHVHVMFSVGRTILAIPTVIIYMMTKLH